jgi:hypothetical protein
MTRNTSDILQKIPDLVVVTRGKEEEHARLRTKNQPSLQAHTTFKIILPESPSAEAGMKMR